MSLCTYVQNKKELYLYVLVSKLKNYVFMFLCLKLKEICYFVLMSETKEFPP